MADLQANSEQSQSRNTVPLSPRSSPYLGAGQIRLRMRHDLMGLSLLLLAGAVSVFFFDAGPITDWFSRHRETRADEIMCVIVALAIGLSIFSSRRWFDLVKQIAGYEKLHHELVEREREAHISSGLFRAVIEGTGDAVYVKDREGRYLMVNPAYLKDFGRPSDAILGRTAAELFAPEEARAIQAIENEVMASGKSRIVEESISSMGQTYLAHVSPHFAHDGTISGIIGISRNVTERMRAHDALRKSEEQTRLLLDSTAEAIYAIDLQGNCTLCNSACARMIGYDSPSELLGKNMHQVLHHTRADGAPYPVKECKIYVSFRQGQLSHVDDEVLWRKDGTSFPAEYWSYPIRRGDELIGSVVTFLDITDRRRAEEQLRQSEERTRLVIDTALDAVISMDQEGLIAGWNAQAEISFGWLREEVIGRRMSEILIPAKYREAHERGIRHFLNTGEGPVLNKRLEICALHREGHELPVELTISPAKLGRTWVFNAFVRDITLRKKAEAELLQANETLRILIEASPVAMVALGPEGIVQSWNPAAERLFGWTEQEVLNHRLPTIPEDDVPDFHNRLRCSLSGQEVPSREAIRLRKDGSQVEISTSIASIRDGQGRITGVMAVMHDITQRKRIEHEIRRASAAAEAANRAKSEFLANMSHEIRTPMNGIIGMTDLALETELTAEQREYLGMVKSSANSLLTIINDILDFSKIEAGKLEFDPIEFNLRNSVEATAKLLALKAHQKGLELVTYVEPQVPEMVVGDPTRMRQIFINLLGNAIKFTQQGEVVLRVELKPSPTTGNGAVVNGTRNGFGKDQVCLHFSVSDTGIGIPEGRQKLIFEAFAQADSSTTRKYGGTGLGLTITARLIKLMGGNIWVESTLGQGSTFHFTIPFAAARREQPHVMPHEFAILRDLAVMIVDDNATNRRILQDTVLHWHMRPTLAEGGVEALALLEHAQKFGTPFPLVLTDAQMPEMDGFTLAQRIKENPALAGATIMMLTSVGQRGDGARCRELGVKAYLTKPITQSELLEAIRAALNLSATREDRLITRHSLREARDGLRVLVAEDNRVNQLLAERLLQQRGHSVVVVNNGLEALARLEAQEFDLVLMDLQMPEMDGFDATRIIREKEGSSGRHLPIVALTAHSMKGDAERCLAAGMDGYISKPLQTTELFALIERFQPALGPGKKPAPDSVLTNQRDTIARRKN